MGIRTKKYGIADVLNKKADLKSIMLRYGEYELDILPGKEMVKKSNRTDWKRISGTAVKGTS